MNKQWLVKGKTYRYGDSPWVREKLAEKPANARGYRYITPKGRPDRRVLIALLPGGKTKAVALLRKTKGGRVAKKVVQRLRRKK